MNEAILLSWLLYNHILILPSWLLYNHILWSVLFGSLDVKHGEERSLNANTAD